MQRILKRAQTIRNEVNNRNLYDQRFNNSLDEWSALCVAMDTLEDTCSALGEYETSGFKQNLGEQYLRIYGFFQSVFLQQDSIRQLHRTFLTNDWLVDDASSWQQLRNLRNLTAGHPLEKKSKGDTERCFISQVMIKNDSLQLVVWIKNTNENRIQDVDLKSLYDDYKCEAIKFLDTIIKSFTH